MSTQLSGLTKVIREVGEVIRAEIEGLTAAVEDLTDAFRAQSAVLTLDPDALAESIARADDEADAEHEARTIHHFHGYERHDPSTLLDQEPTDG